MTELVKGKIKSIVGDKNYLDSYEDRLCYSFDATPIYKQLPEAVIFPDDEVQISKVLKLANQESFNVVPRGAGTGLSGGSVPVENCVVIEEILVTARLHGIRLANAFFAHQHHR